MNKDLNDLLTRARAMARDASHLLTEEANLIDELIAEIERLRPLAELWGRLEEEGAGTELTLYGPTAGARHWTAFLASHHCNADAPVEAVRALLEEVERG